VSRKGSFGFHRWEASPQECDARQVWAMLELVWASAAIFRAFHPKSVQKLALSSIVGKMEESAIRLPTL
jgi:hypothetical protein